MPFNKVQTETGNSDSVHWHSAENVLSKDFLSPFSPWRRRIVAQKVADKSIVLAPPSSNRPPVFGGYRDGVPAHRRAHHVVVVFAAVGLVLAVRAGDKHFRD